MIPFKRDAIIFRYDDIRSSLFVKFYIAKHVCNEVQFDPMIYDPNFGTAAAFQGDGPDDDDGDDGDNNDDSDDNNISNFQGRLFQISSGHSREQLLRVVKVVQPKSRKRSATVWLTKYYPNCSIADEPDLLHDFTLEENEEALQKFCYSLTEREFRARVVEKGIQLAGNEANEAIRRVSDYQFNVGDRKRQRSSKRSVSPSHGVSSSLEGASPDNNEIGSRVARAKQRIERILQEKDENLSPAATHILESLLFESKREVDKVDLVRRLEGATSTYTAPIIRKTLTEIGFIEATTTGGKKHMNLIFQSFVEWVMMMNNDDV